MSFMCRLTKSSKRLCKTHSQKLTRSGSCCWQQPTLFSLLYSFSYLSIWVDFFLSFLLFFFFFLKNWRIGICILLLFYSSSGRAVPNICVPMLSQSLPQSLVFQLISALLEWHRHIHLLPPIGAKSGTNWTPHLLNCHLVTFSPSLKWEASHRQAKRDILFSVLLHCTHWSRV